MQKSLKFLPILAILLIVAFSFQNCGIGGFESATPLNSNSPSNEPDPTSNTAFIQWTVQPSNSSATTGNSATLNAQASSSDPISYQWRKKDAANMIQDIPGATMGNLTLNNLQLSDAGDYFVIAKSAAGEISATCHLTVLAASTNPTPPPPPPAIPYQWTNLPPATVTATVGDNVSFFGNAKGGEPPISYLWYKYNVATSLFESTTWTNTGYSIANVQLADAGTYRLVATDGKGAQLSADVALTVNPK